MMDALQYRATALALQQALTTAGLTIERADQVHGRLVLAPVEPEALLGRLLQLGWRVTLDGQGPADAEAVAAPVPLALVQDDEDG